MAILQTLHAVPYSVLLQSDGKKLTSTVVIKNVAKEIEAYNLASFSEDCLFI